MHSWHYIQKVSTRLSVVVGVRRHNLKHRQRRFIKIADLRLFQMFLSPLIRPSTHCNWELAPHLGQRSYPFTAHPSFPPLQPRLRKSLRHNAPGRTLREPAEFSPFTNHLRRTSRVSLSSAPRRLRTFRLCPAVVDPIPRGSAHTWPGFLVAWGLFSGPWPQFCFHQSATHC